MGAFNVLVAEVSCSSCGNRYMGRVQFKYGDTWQLEYSIGDRLKWGGNDIGIPGITKVKAYGILESQSRSCPVCGSINTKDEFDIYIEKDTIVNLSEIESLSDYSMNEGNYKILIE